MLRDLSQHNGRKLSAAAVEGHVLLLPPSPQPIAGDGNSPRPGAGLKGSTRGLHVNSSQVFSFVSIAFDAAIL
jgi:hypothetical protein